MGPPQLRHAGPHLRKGRRILSTKEEEPPCEGDSLVIDGGAGPAKEAVHRPRDDQNPDSPEGNREQAESERELRGHRGSTSRTPMIPSQMIPEAAVGGRAASALGDLDGHAAVTLSEPDAGCVGDPPGGRRLSPGKVFSPQERGRVGHRERAPRLDPAPADSRAPASAQGRRSPHHGAEICVSVAGGKIHPGLSVREQEEVLAATAYRSERIVARTVNCSKGVWPRTPDDGGACRAGNSMASCTPPKSSRNTAASAR